MNARNYNPLIISDSYLADNFIKLSLAVGLLVNIILWLGILWQSKNFTDLIPLHYSIYFGIDLLGPWYQLFLLPASGLVFLLINFLFGSAVYHRQRILSYFLAGSGAFLQLIFATATIFIILVNY